MEKTLRHTRAIGTLLVALFVAGSAQLSAQTNAGPGNQTLTLSPDGQTVYDAVNNIVWLADANLAGTLPGRPGLRFGLPVCPTAGPDAEKPPTEPCVDELSGTMSYESAKMWVKNMNALDNGPNKPKGYLGIATWRLPTTPFEESSCAEKGPPGNSFGFGCDANALGFLYYTALGFTAPNTAVPIPPNEVGPFIDFQPNLYWSGSPGGGLSCNVATFNFATGAQGGACGIDFLDVLPMIPGKLQGTPANSGMGLQLNPDGKTVYDPIPVVAKGVAGVTWLADANLAASAHDQLGLPLCPSRTTPSVAVAVCVAEDGSMKYDSAVAFINSMNKYDNGKGWDGHNDWQLHPSNASCPLYGCHDADNPMGILFYVQFTDSPGEPVVQPPDITVGPFNNLQPFPYWSCQADTIRAACEDHGPTPAGKPKKDRAEWGFSFGAGLLGTARLPSDHVVTAYYVCALGEEPSACLPK